MPMRRFYLVTRDLHLYAGLFISPFVLLFAFSVFYLVHVPIQKAHAPQSSTSRTVARLHVSADIARMQDRARVDALRPVLDELGVFGEVDFIRHVAAEQGLVIRVRVPGRETTVDLDYGRGTAVVSSRSQAFGDVLVYLHKTPGPHNADVRGNSPFMRIWRVVADGTVYLVLFITITGIYLWGVLKAERRVGLALLAAGAASFWGLVYVIVR
jgi:hypothetical protein